MSSVYKKSRSNAAGEKFLATAAADHLCNSAQLAFCRRRILNHDHSTQRRGRLMAHTEDEGDFGIIDQDMDLTLQESDHAISTKKHLRLFRGLRSASAV